MKKNVFYCFYFIFKYFQFIFVDKCYFVIYNYILYLKFYVKLKSKVFFKSFLVNEIVVGINKKFGLVYENGLWFYIVGIMYVCNIY